MIQQASDNYETRQLQQFYPDIDNMTQEEILRLQESIGFVQTVEEVDKTSKIQEEKFDIVKFKNKNYLRECTICQEEFIEGDILKRLKCDHFYHKNCIKDWLLYNKKCPLCKNEI